MKALSFSEGHVHDGSALDCFACMAPVDAPIAHNTDRCGPSKDVPVVIEDPAIYPWPEGERDRDWHPATDEELNAHYAYWTVAAASRCECGKDAPFDGGAEGRCECCSTCTTTATGGTR